jgi:hypothetical protein
VSLSLAAPAFGPRKRYANLGRRRSGHACANDPCIEPRLNSVARGPRGGRPLAQFLSTTTAMRTIIISTPTIN